MKVILYMLLVSALLAVVPAPAPAEVPSLIHHQGVLTDLNGVPIDGTHNLTFQIYATPDPGAQVLWAEVHSGVYINDGLFNVLLGSLYAFPLGLFDQSELWLGVTVDSDFEISPRARIASVPWALRAAVADTCLSGTGGAGDGHSLDAADGSPVDAVYVNNDGMVITTDVRVRGELSLRYGSGYGGLFIRAYNPNTVGGAIHEIRTGGFREVIRFAEAGDGTPANVEIDGNLSVDILQIRGGSDIAEPFLIENEAEVPDGSLLVIDEDNPGQLKLSTAPYDKRVAGIVSGAGGVRPGMTLTQDEVVEGGRHVALAGRVYALADASGGTIQPGDLLTTSPTPGHAMKATDRDRSQGAVIGKALTSLDSGRGLVLVLVSLQ